MYAQRGPQALVLLLRLHLRGVTAAKRRRTGARSARPISLHRRGAGAHRSLLAHNTVARLRSGARSPPRRRARPPSRSRLRGARPLAAPQARPRQRSRASAGCAGTSPRARPIAWDARQLWRGRRSTARAAQRRGRSEAAQSWLLRRALSPLDVHRAFALALLRSTPKVPHRYRRADALRTSRLGGEVIKNLAYNGGAPPSLLFVSKCACMLGPVCFCEGKYGGIQQKVRQKNSTHIRTKGRGSFGDTFKFAGKESGHSKSLCMAAGRQWGDAVGVEREVHSRTQGPH